MKMPYGAMKATLADHLPPDDDNWAFEVKWDGMRIIAAVDAREDVVPATIRLWSELDFQYHDHSGVVRRTADQVRALHTPPLVIVESVRPL